MLAGGKFITKSSIGYHEMREVSENKFNATGIFKTKLLDNFKTEFERSSSHSGNNFINF